MIKLYFPCHPNPRYNPFLRHRYNIKEEQRYRPDGSCCMIISNEDDGLSYEVNVSKFEVISNAPQCLSFKWEDKFVIYFPAIEVGFSCKSYKVLFPKKEYFTYSDEETISDVLSVTLLEKDVYGKMEESTFYLSLEIFYDGPKDVYIYKYRLSRWSCKDFDEFRQFYQKFEAEKLKDDRSIINSPMVRDKNSKLHFTENFYAEINSRSLIIVTISKRGESEIEFCYILAEFLKSKGKTPEWVLPLPDEDSSNPLVSGDCL